MLHCEKVFRGRYAHFTYNESGLRCFTRWKVFNAIECFHSRGQHLWKFMGIKESVCIRKEFNSHRIGLGHQHGCRFIVLGHQYGRRDVMWKHSIVYPLDCAIGSPRNTYSLESDLSSKKHWAWVEEYVRVENFAYESHAEQVQAGTKGVGNKTTKKSCRCLKRFCLSFKTFLI